MKEDDWLTCGDPQQMLMHLRAGRGYYRKLLLFGCACFRLVWDLMPDERCREVVRVAERVADEEASEEEFAQATVAADRVGQELYESRHPDRISIQLAYAVRTLQRVLERQGYREASSISDRTSCVDASAPEREVHREQHVAFILHIFAVLYPTRENKILPKWLTTDVIALAEGIYAERAWDRMPILADALQDAGCNSDTILNHCRDGGTHVRGCWVIDTILGKV